jgi:catechol-2,3-dioxygenase
MNSTSLYFSDPDGNALELLAVNSARHSSGDEAAK